MNFLGLPIPTVNPCWGISTRAMTQIRRQITHISGNYGFFSLSHTQDEAAVWLQKACEIEEIILLVERIPEKTVKYTISDVIRVKEKRERET